MTRWLLILLFFVSSGMNLFAQTELSDWQLKIAALYEGIFGTTFEPSEAEFGAPNDVVGPGSYTGMNQNGALYDIDITEIVFVDMSTWVGSNSYVEAQVSLVDPECARFIGTLTGPAGTATIFGLYLNYLDLSGNRVGMIVPTTLSPSDWPETIASEPIPTSTPVFPNYFNPGLFFDPTPFPEITLDPPMPGCAVVTLWLDFEVLESFLGVSSSPECQACLADFDAAVAEIDALFETLVIGAEVERDLAKQQAHDAYLASINAAQDAYRDEVDAVDALAPEVAARLVYPSTLEGLLGDVLISRYEDDMMIAKENRQNARSAAAVVEEAACQIARDNFEALYQGFMQDASLARDAAAQVRDACLMANNCIVTCETRIYTFAKVKVDLADLSTEIIEVGRVTAVYCP